MATYVDEGFVRFLALTKGLSEKTIKDYTFWMRDFDGSKLSQDYIDKFIQDRKNSTNVRGAVRSFLEWKKLMKVYDMPPKKTGSEKKRLPREISGDEFERLRSFMYSYSLKEGLLLDVIYEGALREKEIESVKINSFKWVDWLENPDKPCKLAVIGKRDKERIVLISPQTASKIFTFYQDKYNLDTESKVLSFVNANVNMFISKSGQVLSGKLFYDILRKRSLRCLGRNVRPHELRHQRATDLDKIGVHIKDIKNYLGHESIATTETYLHYSEKQSIKNIQDILSKRE